MLFIRWAGIKSFFLIQWLYYLVFVIPFKSVQRKASVIDLIFVYQNAQKKMQLSPAVQAMLLHANSYLHSYSIRLEQAGEHVCDFYSHSIMASSIFKKDHWMNEMLSAGIKRHYKTRRAIVICVTGDIPSPEGRVTTVGGYMGMSHYILLSVYSNKDTLAHEIGHAQGLMHSGDPANLMCSGVRRTGVALKKWQLLFYRYGIFARFER